MRSTNNIMCPVPWLPKSPVLPPSRSEPSAFSVFVHWIAYPVDSRIVANRNVKRIDHDNLKVFVCGILINPIWIENPQVGANTTSAFLRNASQISNKFELINSMILWFSIYYPFEIRALSPSSTHSDTVENKTLSKVSWTSNLDILIHHTTILIYLFRFIA